MGYQSRHPARTSVLPVRGVDYAVHEWGPNDAKTLVCLHGWGDTGRSFQFFVDALFDQACEPWHVLAPDWRGFGDSGHNPWGYWFADYVADLAYLLRHFVGEAPAFLLGHSMGGNVAGLFAGTFPERVAAFVNVEGFGLEDTDPEQAPERYRRWIERQAAGPAFSNYPTLDDLAARIRKQSPAMDVDRARFIAGCWSRSEGDTLTLKADPLHKLPNAVLYRRAEAAACWRRVTAPVLMVVGADSTFAQASHPEAGSFDFDLPFPDRRDAQVPGAGHMVHFEAPEALAKLTRDFLAESL